MIGSVLNSSSGSVLNGSSGSLLTWQISTENVMVGSVLNVRLGLVHCDLSHQSVLRM